MWCTSTRVVCLLFGCVLHREQRVFVYTHSGVSSRKHSVYSGDLLTCTHRRRVVCCVYGSCCRKELQKTGYHPCLVSGVAFAAASALFLATPFVARRASSSGRRKSASKQQSVPKLGVIGNNFFRELRILKQPFLL